MLVKPRCQERGVAQKYSDISESCTDTLLSRDRGSFKPQNFGGRQRSRAKNTINPEMLACCTVSLVILHPDGRGVDVAELRRRPHAGVDLIENRFINVKKCSS